MFTEPKVISSDDLNTRAYIVYYFNGERQREYNGKKLGLKLSPNRATSIKERQRLLKKLLFEIQKALEKGWNPLIGNQEEEDPAIVKSTKEILKEVLNDKLLGSYSRTYKRDLEKVHDQFLTFLTPKEQDQPLTSITSIKVNEFLRQFDTTGTHYMNKRRTIGVLFSDALKKDYITTNPIEKTNKRKSKAALHQIYTPDQIREILKFLKVEYPNLHLCCLLTYGCLLRPHQEARLLKKGSIDKDLTKIKLSGNENKSSRIRTVHIPSYVKDELASRDIQSLESTHNIISKNNEPYNVSYFSLQWSRAKKKMVKQGLLQENQTIYSFRHSAAVAIYRKTKDIYILQQLLGHSNMIVTLKYLRGLGELLDDDLIDAMPEL